MGTADRAATSTPQYTANAHAIAMTIQPLF
jgi:hypothetical protein